jgi:protein involved in polysaccharide export with SLBB domain
MSAYKSQLAMIALVAALGLSACGGPVVKHPTPLHEARAQASTLASHEYVINPGDELDIKFFYTPTLNEKVTVRPDGQISLQLVGEIAAAGRTPAGLNELLIERYAGELKQPEVTVIVRSFSAQKIYVNGEVGQPTLLDLTTRTTVLQSIASAGGFKDTARKHEVIVIRRGTNGEPLVTTVNLEKVIDGTDMTQDIALLPYDLVYVPKSTIANMNTWVDQYISGMLPSELLTIWLINKN